MKKHTLRIISLLVAAMVCLTACGGSSGSTASYMAADASTEENAAYYDTSYTYSKVSNAIGESEQVSDSIVVEQDDRKIVYSGSMSLQTKEFDSALAGITSLVSENGGYISSQEVNGRSLTYSGSYYSRYASLTIRVPVANFESLMTGVSGICNVTQRSVWTDDISDTYYDTEAHLSTLQLQEERLLEILSKADKLEDIITLEKELSDVRYEIESITAQIRRMDDKVEYSTLTLDLNEVVEYSEIEEEPESFGEKLGDAAKRSGRKISDFFENLALWIVEDMPLVLLWAVLILAVLWVALRVLRFVFGKSKPKDGTKDKPRIRRLWKNKVDPIVTTDNTDSAENTENKTE